jgi:hypothetical protein
MNEGIIFSFFIVPANQTAAQVVRAVQVVKQTAVQVVRAVQVVNQTADKAAGFSCTEYIGSMNERSE